MNANHHISEVGRFALSCSLATLFSVGYINNLQAQETGSFMRNPFDAKTLSLAGAGIASADHNTVLDNAALVTFSPERISASLTIMPWMPKLDKRMTVYSAAVSYGSSGAGTFLAGMRTMKSQVFEISDEEGNVIGNSSSPCDLAVEIGWAYPILNELSVSAAMRYLRLSPGYGDAAGAMSFDAGVGYRNSFRSAGPLTDITAIIQIKDFGTSPDYGYGPRSLPWIVNAGVSAGLKAWEKHNFRVGASVDILTSPKLSSDIDPLRGMDASFGVEYSLRRMLYLRGGYHLGKSASYGSGWGSIGVGIHVWIIEADAGYVIAESSSPLRGTYSFTLSCHIG